MPDFNKGDFTQQGVAGHVNANLRLNEKRLVSIDLTSNEEAEGCTIIGTVKDLLNDKVYGIGSGVSGNIEITENGENINVAPYATATVNVSGGGGGSYTYVINETVTTVDAVGSLTSVDVSQLTPHDDLLGVIDSGDDLTFMTGIYVYDSAEEQSLEFMDAAGNSRVFYTEDGINWTIGLTDGTYTVVVIKMPDFYSE